MYNIRNFLYEGGKSMKKRRFMGLLALASCVTLLTGCDSNAFFGLGGKVNEIMEKMGIKEKEDDKKDEPTPEPQEKTFTGLGEVTVLKEFSYNGAVSVNDFKVVAKYSDGSSEEVVPETVSLDTSVCGSIQGSLTYKGESQSFVAKVNPVGEMIINPLPESLFPGDVLDLSEYVTLKKISGGFTVTVTKGEDLVSQQGNVLTIIGEGDLEFTVSAGGHSQSFSYDTMHAIRKEFVEVFEGIGNRYTMDIYAPQYDDNDQYIGMGYDDTLYHSSNYVLTFTSFGTDDDGNYIPGGLLRFSEESDTSYMFTLSVDEEGEEYVELLDQYSSKLLEYYNSDLSVDFSKAAYEYDATNKVEMLVIEGDDAVTFAENSLFIPNGALSLTDGTDIPFNRIEFYFQDIAEEGEEPLIVPCCDSYVLYQGKNEYWNTGVFWLDEESIGYPLLEEYCVPENEPEPFDYYNEFFQGIKLSDLLVSNESVFGPEGFYQLQYGWFNDKGAAIEQPAQATNFFDGYLPVGSNVRYTSSTSIWEVGFNSQEEPYPVSGKTTVNVGSEEEPYMVVYSVFSGEEGYFIEPDYDHETVWDGNLDVFDGLRDPENWELGAITGVEETTFQEQAAYSFTFRGGKFHGLLYSICDGIEGMSLITDTIEWYYDSYGENLEEFFDMEMLVCPAYGYVEFTVTFTWTSGQNYVISVASAYSPSVAQITAAFEEAINPLCLAE